MPRRPTSSASLVLTTCAALAGCGSGDAPPGSTATIAPVDLPAAGFGVRVVDGDRLVVASADGRVLLDGLAPWQRRHGALHGGRERAGRGGPAQGLGQLAILG